MTTTPKLRRVLILGAGKIGFAMALLLQRSADYTVTVADRDTQRLELCASLGVACLHLGDDAATDAAIAGQFAVLNALPFQYAMQTAQTCAQLGVHYFDLTEDVASTQAIQALAANAKTVLMPQCGLAPGFIGIVGNDLAKRFERVLDVRMRVGALPRYPSNALRYNLTWSTDGLINEYCNPCEAIVDGVATTTPAMEGYETFSVDGVEYEAFNTSGGLGTLTHTLLGKVRNVNYKSVRYPGHCATMKLLLNDLRLRERRDLLKEILETAVPATGQDVIVILASATGYQGAKLTEETFAVRLFAQDIGGHHLSAIQLTTASGICAALDMMCQGQLPQSGFVGQEEIALKPFLANRFGKAYQGDAA